MKSLTIALATAKEAIRQPAFFVMAFFAGALADRDDLRVVLHVRRRHQDVQGHGTDDDLVLLHAAWLCLTASSTVAEEIEGKTAITLLSKPINRRQFIIGKFLGIELGVLALYVLLGAVFAAGVWYKYAYDLRESAGGVAESAKQWAQVMQVLPGLALGFFEVTVLTSISVAISTRLPMLANLVVCILIFFLGHLSPVLVEAAAPVAGQRAGQLHGQAVRLGAPVARVLQCRPVDLDRCGHSLDRVRSAGIRLLRVVQWSSVVVRVPLVRGPRPGLSLTGRQSGRISSRMQADAYRRERGNASCSLLAAGFCHDARGSWGPCSRFWFVALLGVIALFVALMASRGEARFPADRGQACCQRGSPAAKAARIGNSCSSTIRGSFRSLPEIC